ncbi:hypothetical protein V8C34DRAFT_295113 [Trichoderma compactum]
MQLTTRFVSQHPELAIHHLATVGGLLKVPSSTIATFFYYCFFLLPSATFSYHPLLSSATATFFCYRYFLLLPLLSSATATLPLLPFYTELSSHRQKRRLASTATSLASRISIFPGEFSRDWSKCRRIRRNQDSSKTPLTPSLDRIDKLCAKASVLRRDLFNIMRVYAIRNEEWHRKPPAMKSFAVKDGGSIPLTRNSMELSLRKAQASVREVHEKCEIGPECDSFIDHTGVDGVRSPMIQGQTSKSRDASFAQWKTLHGIAS